MADLGSAGAERRVVELDRRSGWLPKVVREGSELRLEFAGGADALHDPREFRVPIEEAHLDALRAGLSRHLILWSALGPLCDAAGIDGPLDESAAVALLDPILLGRPDEVDEFLRRTKWERTPLVAYGADTDLLDRDLVMESLGSATESPDWQRAQEYAADARRARRGVTLSPLDAEVLKFTGQYVHGSTIPRRNPAAVDPGRLSDVLAVIETAERARAGLTIARDARRGRTGTDKADWKRMEAVVDAAVSGAYPDLGADALRTVSFLMCSEAAQDARTGPFDVDAAAGRPGDHELTFTDDNGGEKKWHPGDDPGAVEAFWEFVAERVGSGNEVFTLEDETRGEGIQVHFFASSIARIETVKSSGGGADPESRVEYGLVDDLAHYRAMVRACVAGGFDALTGLRSGCRTPPSSKPHAGRARQESVARTDETPGGSAGMGGSCSRAA